MNGYLEFNLKAGALVLACLTLGCEALAAQTSMPEAATVGTPGAQSPAAGPGGVTESLPLHHLGAMTGAPYSAHIESETTQTLADGTTIRRKSGASNLFRDSQGRTRREYYRALNNGDSDDATPWIITIQDPSTGETYSLNPKEHTAREMNRSEHISRGSAEPPAQIATVNPGAVPPIADGADNSSTPPRRIRPKITTEKLGTQEMEGLTAEGRRTTTEYPAGSQGNDRPFSVVTETWTSQELGLTMLFTRNDPRTGQSETRVTNVDRSEPDESLFKVPADYTIVRQETVAVDPE